VDDKMPSGTIWGSFSGKSTSVARPYINWSYTQNTAANQSTITATLVFVRYDGYRSYDNDGQTFTITIDGTPTSQNSAFSMGPNGATDTLFSASKTVTHSDAGEKSVTISASGNTGLVGTISLSATITLTDIPRASGFTAFTLSNTVLNKDTAVTMNYTLDRQSTSFSQDMTLKIGSTVIETWNTTGTGALTRTLTAADVNTILTKVPNATSGTLTLTMQTKNGTSNVGSAKSINEGFSLNSAIAPTASGLTASIYGTGRDKTLNKYVQNISKVTASFTATAGYGATESTHTIIVRRQSDDANSQTITGESGTTANVVTLSGVYEIIATAKDSRGRTATQTITITVDAYSSPSISNFTTVRSSSVTSTVNASISSSWSPLGTSNPASVSIVGVNNVGTSQTLYTLTNSTATGLNTTQAYTGQSDASSFTYTMTITDSFGNKATAIAKVGTSFVELTISKGIGIGIGKVHESGALDVNGGANIAGRLELKPAASGIPLRLTTQVGYANYMEFYNKGSSSRTGYVGHSSSTDNDFIIWGKDDPTANVEVYSGKDIQLNANGNLWTLDGTTRYTHFPRYKHPNGYNFASIRDGGAVNDDMYMIQTIKDSAYFATGSGLQFVDVTWGAAFSATPIWVLATPVDPNSYNFFTSIYNLSSTGCRVYLQHRTNSSGSNVTIYFHVVACGRRV
jgi:hypothetical protein